MQSDWEVIIGQKQCSLYVYYFISYNIYTWIGDARDTPEADIDPLAEAEETRGGATVSPPRASFTVNVFRPPPFVPAGRSLTGKNVPYPDFLEGKKGTWRRSRGKTFLAVIPNSVRFHAADS